MFRMIFTIGQKVAIDEGLAGKDQANPEMSVTARNGRVYAEVGGVALTLTTADANNLTFALKKAVYEAQLQQQYSNKRGGER